MKGNIIIAGLPLTPNLGDVAIFECTKKYIERNIINNKEIRIDSLDLTTATYMGEKFRKWEIIEERLNELLDKYLTNDTRAVIFAGGGLIKYIYQEYLTNAVGLIIERADKINVPVMISAVGIEGYDENNICCQKIKENLNRECVKIITTRDDIYKLKNNYITNKNVLTALVADPVCSLKEFYKPKQKVEGTIGLNVTRKYLFKDNQIDLDEKELLVLWAKIYREITKRGKKCKIFSNGLAYDQEFGESLCDYLGINKEENLVSKPSSVEELVEIISSLEGIIGTRLHCAIIAYAYSIPTVELVWNIKQTMFGEIIGEPRRFIKSDKFDSNYIVSMLMEVMNEKGKDIIYNTEEFKNTTYINIKKFFDNYVQLT